jgi:hypothetical protein
LEKLCIMRTDWTTSERIHARCLSLDDLSTKGERWP